jgi:hypothetical protein
MQATNADTGHDAGALPAAPMNPATGGNLGLIRWFLSLTPLDRLETLESFVDFVTEARNAREAGEVR